MRLWLIVVFVLVAACSSERPEVQPDEPTSSAASGSAPLGSSSHTLTAGGPQRTYRLYRPNPTPRSSARSAWTPPSTAVDATDTIWTFFTTHPKP